MICKAVITDILPGKLKVKTLQAASGCAGCSVAQSCCSSKPQARTSRATVPVDDASAYHTGQEIYLEQCGMSRLPMIIYGVVVPVVILTLLVIAFIDNADPTLGITLGIIALALYFLAMRKLHAPLSGKPRWRIKSPGNMSTPGGC